MGYAVAAAARRAGHEVRLVSGPVSIEPPPGATLVRVTTAAQMLAAVKKNLRWCDVLVMAAAVADWRPKKVAPLKLKKSDGLPRIEWVATPDILKSIAPLKKKSQVFCGFAAETDRLAHEARRKLREKNIDAIAANDVSKKDRGFESDRNALTIFLADGRALRVALSTKNECAKRLMDVLEKICAQKNK